MFPLNGTLRAGFAARHGVLHLSNHPLTPPTRDYAINPTDDWIHFTRELLSPEPIPLTAETPPMISGYEIERELGQGGMGVVYLARNLGLKRLVALKVLRESCAGRDESRRRFRAEAEAVARLHHPNIVQIYDVGEHQGRPYLALEYVEGPTLAQHLDGRPLAPQKAAGLLELLAQAVQHAHEQGVVHRDLKPGNILLSAEIGARNADGPIADKTLCQSPAALRIPKIADFGLAKSLENDSRLTQAGGAVGTPNYMAPEQADANGRAVGPAADIYALGATLYEMLTGRPPFNAADPLDVLLQVRLREVISPRQLNPAVPRDLETICLKCLQKEPSARYIDARALADDLRRFVDGRPILARPISRVSKLLRWARRHPGWAALFVTLACGVIAMVVGSGKLIESNRRERQARQLAERNRDLARTAADDLLTQVAENKRLRRADLAQLRRDLLTRTIPHYQEFVRQTGGDPSHRAACGRAYGQLAMVRRELGETTESLTDFSAMVQIFADLHDSLPDRLEFRLELGRARSGRGALLASLGRTDSALEDLAAACRHFSVLIRSNPNDATAQSLLAECLTERGAVLFSIGCDREAMPILQQAVEQFEKLIANAKQTENSDIAVMRARITLAHVAARQDQDGDTAIQVIERAIAEGESAYRNDPGDPELNFQLSRAYGVQAEIIRDTKRFRQVPDILGRQIDLLDRLSREFPATPVYRHHLALARGNRAAFLFDSPRWKEAIADLEFAHRILEPLASEFPTVLDYSLELGSICANMAVLIDRIRTTDEALTWIDRSVATLEGVLRREPRSVEARRFYRKSVVERAMALQKLGRYSDSAVEWDRVMEMGGDYATVTDPLNQALARALAGRVEEAVANPGENGVLGLVAQLLLNGRDRLPNRSPRPEHQRHCESAAHAVLREADRIGEVTWVERLRLAVEPAFADLRQRADFLAWLHSSK